MAGVVVPRLLSRDNGSFSNKLVSEYGEASFLSMAALAEENTISKLSAGKSMDVNSHDLTIFYPETDKDGRILWKFDKKARWIIGQEAAAYNNVMHTTRDMSRFNSILERVFMCASLMVSFPHQCRPSSELRQNQNIINRKWASPVHAIVSIAPGYFGASGLLEEATYGEYAFIDNKTNNFYIFRVEKVKAVPESFGAYAFRLFTLDEEGYVIDHPDREVIEKMKVCVFDFGGRTFDYMQWHRRRIYGDKYGTEDIGFHQVVDNIIASTMNTFPGSFAKKPTREQVSAAIALALKPILGKKDKNGFFKKPQSIKIPARNGKTEEIFEIVDYHMNILSNRVTQIYQDRLDSGQDVHALLFAGGASLHVRNYMNIEHAREGFISKDSKVVWMANALGAYYETASNGGL